MKTWFAIPARGGSTGIPRKSVRHLAGRPLITHVLSTVSQVADAQQVIVVTDDQEIAAIAERAGVRICLEPPTTGKATLDEVIVRMIDEVQSWSCGLEDGDLLLTVQPTCPFLTQETLQQAIAEFESGEARSVLTAVDDRHLRWKMDPSGRAIPAYERRVNRQELSPEFRESGGIIGARVGDIKSEKTRVVAPTLLIPLGRREGLDIDDFEDWMIAEYVARRKKILIRTDADSSLGMGHVYRCLAIAQTLAHHDIMIVTDREKTLGGEFFRRYPFRVQQVGDDREFAGLVASFRPDLLIFDRLDTTREQVVSLRHHVGRIVSFEDQGSGAQEVDLLVSDLYANNSVSRDKQLFGVDNAILSPSFENVGAVPPLAEQVERILVLFGGTDPSNLTEKSLAAISSIGFEGEVTIVQGLGRKDRHIDLSKYGLKGKVLSDVEYMPGVMSDADLALSSAGRTITELMTLGIPTLCMCQNEKELGHSHASPAHGVLNIGLGTLIDERTLARHVSFLIENPAFRQQMRDRALHESKGRSNERIVGRILEKLNLFELALP